MKYLCLIYDEEQTLAAMPKSESDAFMGEYFTFTQGIRESGHYVAGEALQPVQTATTVRVRNGRVSTVDRAEAPRAHAGPAAYCSPSRVAPSRLPPSPPRQP